MTTKQCKRCGMVYPADAVDLMFRICRPLARRQRRSTTCIPCEQTRKDERKAANRPLWKAVTGTYRARKRLGLSRPAMLGLGWQPAVVEAALRRVMASGCECCASPPEYLSNLCIDLVDPGQPASWGENTVILCRTCSGVKARMAHGDWPLYREAWSRRRESLAEATP